MPTTKAQVTFTLLQCAGLMLLLMLQQQQTAMAHDYIVGDEAYWEVPPFPTYYDVWAAHAGPFVMGDTLNFVYRRGDSVLRVNGLDYATCNIANPIESWTWGPHSYSLNIVGNIYFISGTPGHCASGQRLAMVVI
ncbi:unnamed protein product [Sphagnum troendelagicum]|uniref:Phytocyanin domain-containing protein n=1 Tax=Sphagnum troendelagicum TaxID=128251 RepID=A0ABP0UZA6_9BRYO